MPEFLTTKQVADALAVDVSKVCDWLADGSLVGVNIARHSGGIRPRWRISREALAQFIASRQSAPTPAAPRKKRTTSEAAYY